MADLKRLKGSLDLAQMNHASHQTKDSFAAYEAALSVYEVALAAEEREDVALADFADVHSDEEIEEAQRKLDKLKAVKGIASKASTAKTDGSGSGHHKPAGATVLPPAEVKPNDQATGGPYQDPTVTNGGAAGVPSEATIAGQAAADEEKKSGVPGE